jgi:hypothetical protein
VAGNAASKRHAVCPPGLNIWALSRGIEEQRMNDQEYPRPFSRREALAALGVFALSLVRPSRAAASSAPIAARWNDRLELAVNLEIAQPQGGRARRPYVAVWIESPAGEPISTLSLWVQNSGRGPRWISELRRWYRGERAAQESGSRSLVSTMSSPTRTAGAYTVLWNGRNDAGQPVDQGEYHVCIEAAREHGTYQLIRHPYTFASRAFRAELDGNAEISRASVDFRERR